MEISHVIGVPVRIEPRLVEQNFGRWEGTARDGLEFARAKENFADSYGGGESMMKTAQRIYNLIDDIEKEPEKTYLLVAHNGISRMIESYFRDMRNEEFAAFGIKNAEVREYKFEVCRTAAAKEETAQHFRSGRTGAICGGKDARQQRF
jgi:probable phosphoglycerate mutase